MRARRLSLHTERTYLAVIEQFIRFHHQRPELLGADEVCQFLTHMAVDRQVTASTQNVAFNALLWAYRNVLDRDLDNIAGVCRAQRPRRLPVVSS